MYTISSCYIPMHGGPHALLRRETADGYLTPGEMKEALKRLFSQLGELERVLIIPPTSPVSIREPDC